VGETEALMSRISREKAEVVEPKKAIVDDEVKQVWSPDVDRNP
jgi:hypothetical protein